MDKPCGELVELLLKAGAASEAKAAGGVLGDVHAVDRLEHAPAEPRIDVLVTGEIAGDDRRGVGDQLGTILR